MADDNNSPSSEQPATPNPALKGLDRLVGTWNVSGQDIDGQVTFEWMEGGFFFTQHVDLVHGGHVIKGIEIIGYDEESKSLKSQFFGNMAEIFKYTWEVSDDTLTIWGGEVGSPAVFKGKFSADDNSNTGAWEWPGGGYESSMTRATSQ
jgi:hypothetical protein